MFVRFFFGIMSYYSLPNQSSYMSSFTHPSDIFVPDIIYSADAVELSHKQIYIHIINWHKVKTCMNQESETIILTYNSISP